VERDTLAVSSQSELKVVATNNVDHFKALPAPAFHRFKAESRLIDLAENPFQVISISERAAIVGPPYMGAQKTNEVGGREAQ
jgi:hypothetical protein